MRIRAYDAVIVGAGPAGSTVARLLAEGGARVCLIEKARFPRAKACGGALSPRTLRYLPPGVDSVLRARVHRAVFTFQSRRSFEIVSAGPMGYMVCREEFDAWLRAGAEAAGAHVREGVAVGSIEERSAGITLRTSTGPVTASTVIGADGVASLVAAQLFPRRPPARYIAVETEVTQDGKRLEETVLVDVGAYPGGYAWAFPKGDRVNVGVMVEASRARGLREALSAFVAQNPVLPAAASTGLRAAPVAAARSMPVPCARPGALLVGDAAHLADPFLGEGIYYALQSGRLAAQAILGAADREEAAARYGRGIAEGIWPDLAAASRVALLFHRMPRWWHHLLSRMPNSLSQVVAVLGGEDSYTGLLGRILQQVESRAGAWVRNRLGVRSPDGTRADEG
jgi:geranylgeranyl reductase family protein